MEIRIEVSKKNNQGRYTNKEIYKEHDYFQVTQMALEEVLNKLSLLDRMKLMMKNPDTQRLVSNAFEHRLHKYHVRRLKRNKTT